MNLIEKVFGTHSERELKLIRPIVDKILGMREQMVALSDDELRDNTRKFKERLANGETLDDLLPEAFATVREAARRVLNMEHYPVQLIGVSSCIRDVSQRCVLVKVKPWFPPHRRT